jgi:hypothetical protein
MLLEKAIKSDNYLKHKGFYDGQSAKTESDWLYDVLVFPYDVAPNGHVP